MNLQCAASSVWSRGRHVFTSSKQLWSTILLPSSILSWVLTRLLEEGQYASNWLMWSQWGEKDYEKKKKRRKSCISVKVIFMPCFLSCGIFLLENSHLQVNSGGFFPPYKNNYFLWTGVWKISAGFEVQFHTDKHLRVQVCIKASLIYKPDWKS